MPAAIASPHVSGPASEKPARTKPRNAKRPATRAREENRISGDDKLVALADRVARPGLEDGTVGIAHGKGRLPSGDAELVVGNVRMRRVLPHRSSTARWRDELAGICEPPDSGSGRKIGWRHSRSHGGKAQAAGQVDRARKNASREASAMSGHRVLLCDTVSGIIGIKDSSVMGLLLHPARGQGRGPPSPKTGRD